MRRIRHVSPLTLITLVLFAAFAVYVFATDHSGAAEAHAEPAVRWEYALVRIEGVQENRRDQSISVLNRFGREGWEAVELLPPSYDILMKRPVTTDQAQQQSQAPE